MEINIKQTTYKNQKAGLINGTHLVLENGDIISLYYRTKPHLKKINPVKLKARKHSNGYLRVGIQSQDFYIHRLVAQAFIPNFHNLPEVNHIDGNKRNNEVKNLEWCTRQQNNKHMFEIGIKTSQEMGKISRSDKAVKARKARRTIDTNTARKAKVMIENGIPNKDIRTKLNISKGVLDSIKYGKGYAEVKI